MDENKVNILKKEFENIISKYEDLKSDDYFQDVLHAITFMSSDLILERTSDFKQADRWANILGTGIKIFIQDEYSSDKFETFERKNER